MRAQLLWVTLFILCLRLPFLNQAIQGDDIYYLAGAEHAQIDPLHPNHARYMFLGKMVDMRGHPHPPLNVWFLGALLALFGDIYEVPFHAAYIPFSLIAGWSALAIARKFSSHPLPVTLLALSTPAFIVNGTSFEADLPFLAFFLASIALYVYGRFGWSCLVSALAAMAAFQAILLAPILFLYDRRWRWSLLTVPLVLLMWQLCEKLSTGNLPATVLAGYMQSEGLQTLGLKALNAISLTGHLGWIVTPFLFWPMGAAALDPSPLLWGSLAAGTFVLVFAVRHWRRFPAQWVLVYFAAALVLFFAGSARYLLPIAVPVALLVPRTRWLWGAVVVQLALGLALAMVNYQHWDGYRQFARTVHAPRTWVNGEWGLRYYLEKDGALPLAQGQVVHPGEMVVSSKLAFPMRVNGGFATVAERTITSAIPLRIVGLTSRSGYSSDAFGLRPFDISTGAIDRVKAEVAVDRKPALSYVAMNQAGPQIVQGLYDLEEGAWRWTGERAVLLLKPPDQPMPIWVRFVIPDPAPARRVTVTLDGLLVADERYPKPGTYMIKTKPVTGSQLTISVDRTFSVAGDSRNLGIILAGAGFAL